MKINSSVVTCNNCETPSTYLSISLTNKHQRKFKVMLKLSRLLTIYLALEMLSLFLEKNIFLYELLKYLKNHIELDK